MKVLAFFNNKGGVGKTTLACNYAHYVSTKENKKVLVLDLDPQGNATQLLLPEDIWHQIYNPEKKGATKTIMKSLEKIRKGYTSIVPNPAIIQSENFQVDLIPGHPELSLVEDFLSEEWGDLYKKRASFDSTNWMNILLSDEALSSYDLVIVDVGPSLGSLNRSVLLSSTHYITPVEADLFSLYALENIGQWMNDWIKHYLDAVEKYSNDDFKDGLIIKDLKIESGYIGYTTKQYIAKRDKNGIRKIKSYERYMSLLPKRAEKLIQKSAIRDKFDSMSIGIMPNMFSMIPRAQEAHKPISELTTKDGLIGGQPSQLKIYVQELNKVFKSISDRLEA